MTTIFDIANRKCPAKPGLGGNFFTLSGKSEKIGFRTQKKHGTPDKTVSDIPCRKILYKHRLKLAPGKRRQDAFGNLREIRDQ